MGKRGMTGTKQWKNRYSVRLEQNLEKIFQKISKILASLGFSRFFEICFPDFFKPYRVLVFPLFSPSHPSPPCLKSSHPSLPHASSPCLKPSPCSSPCLKPMPSPCLKPMPQAHPSLPQPSLSPMPQVQPSLFPLIPKSRRPSRMGSRRLRLN